jgi:ribosomal-protein-alanine N-acetyltransferase
MFETPVIETERTVLEILSPQKAGLLQEYVVENRQHLEPWEPERDDRYFTLEDCRGRLRISRAGFEAGTSCDFSALDRNTGVMVGSCNFSNITEGVFMACTLGYSIAERHQGTGLMHEILQAGIDYMFQVRDMHRIMANHIPYNHRSERLLRRLGFQREGYARAYLNINGRWRDHVLNSLINPNHPGGEGQGLDRWTS